MKLKVFALCWLFTLTYGCKKNEDAHVTPPPPPVDTNTIDIVKVENDRLAAVVTTQSVNAFVAGIVTNEEGKGLAGVSVSTGAATVTTNESGFFQFPSSVLLNKDYATILATQAGYFKAVKTFTPNRSGKANHYFKLILLKQSDEKTVSTIGGNIVLDNNVSLVFPKDAVVNLNGSSYSGNFKVAGRYLNPASVDFLETMPGLLAGLNDQNQIRALRSYGMAAVELKDMNGNLLQVAPGKTVILKLPAPADGPAAVPLWHFNEKYGIWIKAGNAIKTGESYSAEVNHFSVWNIDVDFNGFELTLQFKDEQNNILPGLQIEAFTQSNNKIVSFFTDNEGKATLINCPASEPLILKTIFECDTLLNQLNPLTASRTETVILPNGSGMFKVFSVNGVLRSCDNAALPNKPFQLSIKGSLSSKMVPCVTDDNGNFSVTSSICTGLDAASVQLLCYINNEYRYSPSAAIVAGNNTYNPNVCDTTTGIPDDFVVLFPDHALDSMVRKAVGKMSGSILYRDVKNIAVFGIYGSIVTDISGMQFMTGLKNLRMSTANCADLSPLQSLQTLQSLEIRESIGFITDITPLRYLVNLEFLDLTCPLITDITPLAQLQRLSELHLDCDQVINLLPLEGLSTLKTLSIINENLSDISPLQSLVNLTSLSISHTKLSDLTVLSNLISLNSLYMGENKISNVTPLQNLQLLENLALDYNDISDITPLINGVPGIKRLTIINQTSGPLSTAQKNAFITAHPTADPLWD